VTGHFANNVTDLQPEDHQVLAKRHALYQQARNQHPHRWSGATRNWQPIGAVTLNPEREQTALQMAA
jgi:putative transposase